MPERSSDFGTISRTILEGYNGLEVYPPQKQAGILQPLNIQGIDDLRRVPDTTIFPYCCICFLKIQAQDGAGLSGTGWLAGPRVVITAGHCVYDHGRGGKMVQIEVLPGCNGDAHPFGSCMSENFEPAEGWKKSKSEAHDYGVIFLPENSCLGKELGCFGYADWGKDRLTKFDFCLSGYPIDEKKPLRKPGTQWYDKRKLTDVDDFRLYYLIDTLHGDSGAPLWRVDEEKNRHVVGIHNYGLTGTNFATRINDAVFQQIEDWRTQ